jgi:hypothetical protein|tara:strand:- start:4367 stop:4597 length:231 start_codon:yes stop_codon:yes gene_type:complete
MAMTELMDILLMIVAAGFGWWANNTTKEVKRLEILLNKTREEYATRGEVKAEMGRVMEALHRVEDKLDRILSSDRL